MTADTIPQTQAAEKLNPEFDIPLEQVEGIIKTKVNGDCAGYDRVIPPRALVQVKNIWFLKREVFEALIKHIPLRGFPDVFPYRDAEIDVFDIQPRGFDIGQTFVLERKILDIMQNLEGKLFSRFCTRGISSMPPVQLYGLDADGKKAMAFYIPPIIEIHQVPVLIDGVHRSYLCNAAGTTIHAVHVRNVSEQLPFDSVFWEDCSLVKEKPPREQRYRNLKMDYFRALNAVGIDG
ncbi:hypothetical protein FJZ19_03440 [Candidatus Pacearchaeota archaeon]|nr:hypothetical protein [Candidatus Pacearchaeota archaeon]